MKYWYFLLLLLTPLTARADVIPAIDDKNGRVKQVGFDPNSSNAVYTVNSELQKIFHGRFLIAIYTLLGGLAVIIMIYAGIQYITSRGSAEKVKAARQTILNVMLGVIVLVLSYVIINTILAVANYLAITNAS